MEGERGPGIESTSYCGVLLGLGHRAQGKGHNGGVAGSVDFKIYLDVVKRIKSERLVVVGLGLECADNHVDLLNGGTGQEDDRR